MKALQRTHFYKKYENLAIIYFSKIVLNQKKENSKSRKPEKLRPWIPHTHGTFSIFMQEPFFVPGDLKNRPVSRKLIF